MSILLATLIILLSSVTGTMYKLGGKYHTDNIGIALTVFGTGAILLILYHILIQPFIIVAYHPAYMLGIGCGILQSLTLVAMLYCIRHIPLGLSFTVLNLSIVIPSLYGLIGYGDVLSTFQILGLVLFPFVIIIFTLDINRGKLFPEGEMPPIRLLGLLGFIFLANGTNLILMAELRYQELLDFRLNHMFGMQLTAIILLGIIQLKRRRAWGSSVLVLGGIGGTMSVFGVYLYFELFKYLVPSVAIPLCSTGQLVVLTWVGWAFFKDKLNKLTLVGMAIAILAIVFLNISTTA